MSSWWGASSDEATCQPKSEIPGRPQKFRGKHGVDFFYNSQKEPTPMTLSSQTSSLQKCKWINVPCCRLPICGTLLWRPQETKKRWFQDSKEEKKVSAPRDYCPFTPLSGDRENWPMPPKSQPTRGSRQWLGAKDPWGLSTQDSASEAEEAGPAGWGEGTPRRQILRPLEAQIPLPS